MNNKLKIIIANVCIVLMVWVYLYVWYKISQVKDPIQTIKCDMRYIWDSYWWEIRYKDWDYIYLSWYKSIDTMCAIDESMVNEWTPLCWTVVQFSWPLDTSNMNCYEEWNAKSILKAFKKQAEDEKKEDDRYYTCDLKASELVYFYNNCETIDCATYRIREYLKDTCPRATIK